ncbi:MAG: ABC transporter substrate-binding protein, partial [Desulfurococcaceae archaeon]
MLREYSFVSFALGLMIVIAVLLPVTGAYETAAQQWPWGSKEEPYPWLDYLASLTTVRNVRLVVLTRHESSIQSLTRILFLNSPVAAKLGITGLQFVYQEASLWPETIRRARVSIDVAWGGGPTLFNMLDEMGFLLPINPTAQPEHYAIMYELSKIPETIAGSATYKVDAHGNIRWIGASVSSFGFTVNKLILERYGLPKPRSWEDLTNPVYIKYYPAARLIGLADPTKSTSNLRIFEIILQARGWNEGWRILTLMAANSIVYSGSGDVRDAVTIGDIAVGTTIDFYGYMAMSVNPYCEYVAPEGETIVNADPIAILNTTKYPVHAAAFVAWVLSEFGGQLVWLHRDINR